MPRILTRCPADGRVVPTGHRMTTAQLESSQAKFGFRCSACAMIHYWVRAEAWVENDGRV